MDQEDLISFLNHCATPRTRPDGSSYRAILLRDVQDLSDASGKSPKEVEIAALENGIVPEHYARNQTTLSLQSQVRLLKSHVAVVGLGGLGGMVTEILARIGIGTLTLLDGDRFEESNLNRQALSGVDTLGLAKSEAATHWVRRINPVVETRPVMAFLTKENAGELLQGADMAVDCLDTIPDRFVLESACRKKGIALVSSAIGGTTGQATVILPSHPGLVAIYGDPAQCPPKGIESVVGTLPFTAVFMAAVACAQAVTLAIGNPSPLQGRLFIADVFHPMCEVLDLDTPTD